MELRFPDAQHRFFFLNIAHGQAQQFAHAQTARVKQHDGEPQGRSPQRRADRFRKLGCEAEHAGDLPRLDDDRRDMRLVLGSAFDCRKKTAGFVTPSIDTEETCDLIPFAPRVGMVFFEACQPTAKGFGIEIAAPALCDMLLELAQHAGFLLVAMTKGVFVGEELSDR